MCELMFPVLARLSFSDLQQSLVLLYKLAHYLLALAHQSEQVHDLLILGA